MPNTNKPPKVKLLSRLTKDPREGHLFTVRVDGFPLMSTRGFVQLSADRSNGAVALNHIAKRLLSSPLVFGARASSSLLIVSVTDAASRQALQRLLLDAFEEAGLEVSSAVLRS